MKKFKAGIFQFDVKLGKVDDNVKTVMAGLDDLADKGADLVLLPEMWSCGFDNGLLMTHAEKTPDILSLLGRVAAQHNMAIAGSLPEVSDNAVSNTLYLIDQQGRIKTEYRKIHLFKPGNEHIHFKAGNTVVSSDLPFGTVGLMTCYDLRFPELSRMLTLKGVDCLLVAAQWPRIRVEHWDVLLKARAIENQVFVLAANRCGDDPNLSYAGHSQIITPWGDVLTQARDQETVLCADILPEALERARQTIPCLDDRRPMVYSEGELG